MASVQQRVYVSCVNAAEVDDTLLYFQKVTLPEGQKLVSLTRDKLLVTAIINQNVWTPPDLG